MKYFSLLILQIFTVGLLSAQDLILDDGIYAEKPLLRDTTKHKYSLDNISYKLNSTFIFDYYYIDLDGQKKKFLRSENESSKTNPLNLASLDNKSDSVIGKIKMHVDDDNEMFVRFDSSYTQTTFMYTYLDKTLRMPDTLCEYLKKKNPGMACGDEGTGIVDNKKNLWIHPPRTFTFKILQLNPFPFYYRDETVKSWSWSLETGGSYLDPRWINSQRNITINYTYHRLPDEIIETPLGKLQCKVTDGSGTCKLKNGVLKTSLKSFYYPNYGFVRLEYENINGTKLVMQLIEAK